MIKLKTEGNVPRLFKKRDKKLFREYRIIDRKYEEEIEEIKRKKEFEEVRYGHGQVDMLRKLKRNKIYYKLTTSWDTSMG